MAPSMVLSTPPSTSPRILAFAYCFVCFIHLLVFLLLFFFFLLPHVTPSPALYAHILRILSQKYKGIGGGRGIDKKTATYDDFGGDDSQKDWGAMGPPPVEATRESGASWGTTEVRTSPSE